jgi:hypothetical protein
MRENTIKMYKEGKFPQTNSFPHREVKGILENVFENFEEEFKYGNFIFDFKIGNFLIEVQGDYFHCNPNTRHYKPKNSMQIKNVERDKRKRNYVEKKAEYVLVEIWEFDIVNNKKEVIKWIENLKK